MAIQSHDQYVGCSVVGTDEKTHRLIVVGLEELMAGSAWLPRRPTQKQIHSIGGSAGVDITVEVVRLYGLLRESPRERFGDGAFVLATQPDQVLVHEALAFHANIGGLTKLRDFYANIFQ